jgi:uncharacterized protein
MPNESIDVQTLQYILSHLVTVPADIKIDRQIDEKGVLISVLVNAKDMGIVIGRNGVMANAIKTYMRALGKAHNMNIRVEFLEPDGSVRYSNPGSSRPSEEENSSKAKKTSIDDDLEDFVIN